MSAWITGLAAALGVVAASVVTGFFAEDYRRFRDGKVLAAAFAGELDSYMQALEMAADLLPKLIGQLESQGDLSLQKVPEVEDWVFAARVGDLGLLGSYLSGELVFVYHQIKVFRVAMAWVNDAETVEMKKANLEVARWFSGEAFARGKLLVENLKQRSSRRYRPFRD